MEGSPLVRSLPTACIPLRQRQQEAEEAYEEKGGWGAGHEAENEEEEENGSVLQEKFSPFPNLRRRAVRGGGLLLACPPPSVLPVEAISAAGSFDTERQICPFLNIMHNLTFRKINQFQVLAMNIKLLQLVMRFFFVI